MTPIRTICLPYPMTDPNGSVTPRNVFTSNTAYSVSMDAQGVFYITGLNTNITLKYDGPAGYIEQPPAVENFPSKAELLTRIDEIEVRTLGTKRGKKV
jgi:hypothetical protein